MPLFRIVVDGEEDMFILTENMACALAAWLRRIGRDQGLQPEEVDDSPDQIHMIADDEQCLNTCGFTVAEHENGVATCKDDEDSHHAENN